MKKLIPFLLIIVISTGIAWHFCYTQIYSDFWQQQLAKVQRYVSCVSGEPEQYRVIQYAAILGVYSMGVEIIQLAAFVVHAVVLSLAFMACWAYYKRLGIKNAWAGLALASYCIVYSHAKSGMAEGYYLELAFYMFGFVAMLNGRWWWVFALTVIGAFNRETIIFLPVIALIYGFKDKRAIRPTVWAIVAVIAIHVLLRAGMPQDSFTPTPLGIRQGWGTVAYNLMLPMPLLYFLGYIGFIPLAFRYWPRRLWSIALLIPIYLLLTLNFGVIAETRMMMLPFIAVLIPAILMEKPQPK